MKKTLTTGQAASMLLDDQYRAWSYNGAHALVEWLEELEDATDEEIEFDRVALRCDFTEYELAIDACREMITDFEPEGDDDDEREENALDLLRDETTVIEFIGGVIVQSF